jgi:hypothetical protein
MVTFRFTEGNWAVVYIANKKFAWYPLTSEAKQVSIPTRIGPVVIEIGAGSARVVHSPCPNQQCVKTGKIRHSHAEIVCLPARILLTLEGQDEYEQKKSRVDAITY